MTRQGAIDELVRPFSGSLDGCGILRSRAPWRSFERCKGTAKFPLDKPIPYAQRTGRHHQHLRRQRPAFGAAGGGLLALGAGAAAGMVFAGVMTGAVFGALARYWIRYI
jgi:hypothetical protein